MKKCPLCAEEIQDAAIECQYCGSMLDQATALAAPASQTTTGPAPAPRDEFEDVRELALQGRKVDAIKLLLTKRHGLRLKEAKKFVETGCYPADALDQAATVAPMGSRDRSQTIELVTKAAPSDAFKALISSLGPSELTLLSRDDERLSLSAEHPWSFWSLSNSWGEDVTAEVVPADTGSIVRITCSAKSRMGSATPEQRFRSLQTQLRERLGSAEVAQSSGVGGRYSARTMWSAQTEKLDGELARAIGANGVVVLFSDKVAILRIRKVLTALNQGMKGDKEIRLSRITSIQLRKPSGVTRGYIQFELMGGNSSQAGLLGAVKDENTVLFDRSALPSFLSIKGKIEEQLSASEKARSLGHVDPATNSPTQQLKEWKELLDLGAITPAEYEAKKVEILRKS